MRKGAASIVSVMTHVPFVYKAASFASIGAEPAVPDSKNCVRKELGSQFDDVCLAQPPAVRLDSLGNCVLQTRNTFLAARHLHDGMHGTQLLKLRLCVSCQLCLVSDVVSGLFCVSLRDLQMCRAVPNVHTRSLWDETCLQFGVFRRVPSP